MPNPITQAFKQLLPASWVHRIKQARLRRVISSFQARTVTHQYGGHTLSVRITDPIAAGWYDRDYADLPEVAFLKMSRLKPGAVVFDLGAHQGVVAMMLALAAAPGGKVVAVEGTQHNAEMARQNLALNHIENVRVIHAIVADASGRKVSFSSTLNGSVGAGGEPVTSVCIDDLASEYGTPDLVFIDIEGFECQALQGAHTVLSQGADFCIEVHEGCGLELHGSKEMLASFFPPETHRCFVSYPEGASFKPWAQGEPLPNQRFFLIARSLASMQG